jgi:CRP-like cAMP-binding protein
LQPFTRATARLIESGSVRPGSRASVCGMPRLLIVGELDQVRTLLDLLPGGEYSVTLVPDVDAALDLPAPPGDPALLLTPVPDTAAVEAAMVHDRWAWLAWNRADDPAATNAAYEQGALAVLPARLTREGLASALRTAFARAQDHRRPAIRLTRGEGRFERGARIHIAEDDVLVVETGIVATTVLHDDGAEVLTALHGPGSVVIGHPEDSCCLQIHAHTTVRAIVQGWAHIAGTPRFAERLRARVRRMEAWAAVQARPHLQDRVIGLLSLLAESFGEPRGAGVCIDVRLTHGQVAAAIGATRATVTRVIGKLRAEGVLDTEGDGQQERFVLHVVERHVHH